jgi:hypothetical protein
MSVRDGVWKFIPANARKDGQKHPDTGRLGDPDAFVKGEQDTGSWNVDQLYNTAMDPGETHNLAGAQPERVAAMRAKLQNARTAGRTRP